jgi:tetratricopeptide (TPR) repeat protein
LLKSGRPREALKTISRFASEKPRSADLLAIEGLALVAMGETVPARLALQRSLAIRPASPMAMKVLAAIAFSRGEEQQGLKLLNSAAAIDPGDFRPCYAMGEAYLRLGRMEDALLAFRAALERDSHHTASRIGVLTALLASHPPEESSDLVHELLQAVPGNPMVQVLAARHARAMGDATTALRHAEHAVELDPELVEAILIRAQLNFVAGKRAQALADAEHAAARNPANLAALALLAQLQEASGQAERARTTRTRHQRLVAQSERMHELTEEIAQHPDDPTPRYQLGQVAAEMGAKSLAAESYRAALAIDAQCQQALIGLRALEGPPQHGSANSSRESAASTLPVTP